MKDNAFSLIPNMYSNGSAFENSIAIENGTIGIRELVDNHRLLTKSSCALVSLLVLVLVLVCDMADDNS
jgi:hypothetical protein